MGAVLKQGFQRRTKKVFLVQLEKKKDNSTTCTRKCQFKCLLLVLDGTSALRKLIGEEHSEYLTSEFWLIYYPYNSITGEMIQRPGSPLVLSENFSRKWIKLFDRDG